MDSQKQEVAERIKQANNILVTVSNNPSVDQLSACIGLTLAFNKMGKHATAVFSGEVPSTIEFLQPEKTIEKNTDSLRDFIIALDKSKADKLRYKVEDKVVKIFITPYRTSISDKDLEFSQGDFNVDVVLALGVHNQADLDQAITAHGRILHDATVMAVNIQPGGDLGNINWLDPAASSLSELAVQLTDTLDKKLIDNQIATAFLTGIVAATDRFSNEKTSPQTMSISAELMGAGANQQLVATKLEEPVAPPASKPEPAKPAGENADKASATPAKPDDGTLEITHDDKAATASDKAASKSEEEKESEPAAPQIHIDDQGSLELSSNEADAAKKPEESKEDKSKDKGTEKPAAAEPPRQHDTGPRLVLQPPRFDSQMAASTAPTGFPGENSLTLPQVEPAGPLLDREPLQTPSVGPTITPPADMDDDKLPDLPGLHLDGEPQDAAPTSTPTIVPPITPPPKLDEPTPAAPSPSPKPPETLSQIEKEVNSSHIASTPPAPAPMPATSVPPITPPAPQPPVPTLPELPPSPIASPAPVPAPAPAAPAPTVDSARDAVSQAIGGASAAPSQLEPLQSLNAQRLGDPLHASASAANPADTFSSLPPTPPPPAAPAFTGNITPALQPESPQPMPAPQPPNAVAPPSAPPAVPPPMLPPVQPPAPGQ